MITKHYSNDWAKEKSRELVKEMIQRNLLKFRKSKDLKVICFPGVDATEIHQIYDPLGIPRQNIIGVEREREIARTLERKNLGIQIVNQNLEDYINEQESFDLDVISLDYIGPINQKQIDVIRKISYLNKKRHMVLHTANLLRRDNSQIYFEGHINAPLKIEEYGDPAKTGNIMSAVKRRIDRIESMTESESDLKGLKDTSYSNLVINALERLTVKDFRDAMSFFIGKGLVPKDLDLTDSMTRVYLMEHAYGTLRLLCKDARIIDEDIYGYIFNSVVVTAKNNELRVKDSRRYSYISESGAPMIGDVYFVSENWKLINGAKDLAHVCGFPQFFHVKNIDKFYQAAATYCDLDLESQNLRHTERIFLGNSSKPILTKGRAIEEFRSGADIGYLQSKYRGWRNLPLAQWKAHLTMGTYDREELKEDSNAERIQKEEAIYLLSEGIPVEEILEAYPTSFRSGQLRAFKAHLTMGDYAK